MLTQTFVSLAQRLSPAVVNIVIERGGEQSEREAVTRADASKVASRAQGSSSTPAATSSPTTTSSSTPATSMFTCRMSASSALSSSVEMSAPTWRSCGSMSGTSPAVGSLGDSDHVQIGEWVMAIGSPFGLSQTVTVGIVSAKGRREVQPGSQPGFFDFLQTDAPINPGNSGGPLINVAGEVIGINSAMNVVGSGIGFAIPSNLARSVAEQLHRHGYVLRSWLGCIRRRSASRCASRSACRIDMARWSPRSTPTRRPPQPVCEPAMSSRSLAAIA